MELTLQRGRAHRAVAPQPIPDSLGYWVNFVRLKVGANFFSNGFWRKKVTTTESCAWSWPPDTGAVIRHGNNDPVFVAGADALAY